MDLSFWLLNAAYAVYVVSPVFKTMVKLRIVLLLATILFIAYGLSSGVMSVTWWNLPFGAIHLWQLWKISPFGQQDLDAEAAGVHSELFPTLSQTDFATIWKLGEERIISVHEELTTQGERVADLTLILDGNAAVVDEDVTLTSLDLVGEMSLLLGGGATRTVCATSEMRVRTWPKAHLVALGEKNPHLKSAGLVALGQSLAQKVA